MDKLQEEFIKVFESDKGYKPTAAEFSEGFSTAYEDGAWWAWKASREAIDAPGKMSEWPDDNHGEYGRGYNDCHAEWEQALGISDGD